MGNAPMREVERAGQRRTVTAVHRQAVPDYQALVEPLLPVLEASQVQLRPGPPPSTVSVFSSPGVAAMRVRHHAASVGVIIMKPEYFAYMAWAGTEDCRINGVPAEARALHAQGAQDGFHACGGARETMGIAVRRDLLVDTLAALRGIDPEDVTLTHTGVELSPRDAPAFRRGLTEILMNAAAPGRSSQAATWDPAAAILGLLVDAELGARPELMQSRAAGQPEQVVRKAEERFFANQGAPVSLADLCAAARVSQATLYRAFHQVCGEPPLAYLHKRRLGMARRRLLGSLPERGAVKRAALDAGLTELGRFSVEYRRLFGESPSVTLARGVAF